MTILFIILAVLSAFYGTSVLLVGTGTLFFTVWYFIAAVFCFCAWLCHSGTWRRLSRGVRTVVCVLCTALLLSIGVSMGFVISGMHAETQQEDYDYLIVLGAQVYPDGPSAVLKYRLDAAYDYLVDHPETGVIVCGCQGPHEVAPEAKIMAEYLIGRGIEPERIVVEDKSTDTQENLAFAAEKVPGLKDLSVGIVTNNFHVFRSTLLAERQGFTHVSGIPAYCTPWYVPNNVLRESLALIKAVILP